MAEDKKRSVTALCLVTVMVFMWIKVFTKKAPEGAGAALMTGQVEHGNQVNERYRVLFIELPKVAGRNDVIVRDFFASDGWQHFVNGKERKPTDNVEVNVVSSDDEEIRKVAKKLKLQAILLRGEPLVFINNNSLRAGETLLIRDGAEKYVCEVVEIKENTVVMRCREAEITLKLPSVSMTEN
ncbi:MAG: hypothetical protein ACYSW0_08105 [Planctomycetota bacterium]